MPAHPVDPNCIFCRIAQKQVPAALVYDTPAAVAFLDIQPIAPGHLLVIPLGHYPTLAETPPEVLSALISQLPHLARCLMQALEVPALNILCNNGPEAGQVIPHVHFHLIPRRRDDGLIHHVKGQPQDALERDALRNRIISLLTQA